MENDWKFDTIQYIPVSYQVHESLVTRKLKKKFKIPTCFLRLEFRTTFERHPNDIRTKDNQEDASDPSSWDQDPSQMKRNVSLLLSY